MKNPLVDKTDLSSLTCVRMTGAPLGAALQQLIIDKFPKSTHVGNGEYFFCPYLASALVLTSFRNLHTWVTVSISFALT